MLYVKAPAGGARTVLRRAQLRKLGVTRGRTRLVERVATQAPRTILLPAAQRR